MAEVLALILGLAPKLVAEGTCACIDQWGYGPRVTAKAEILLRHAEGRVEKLAWKQDKDVYRVICPGSGMRTLAVIWNNDKYLDKNRPTLVTYLCKSSLPDPTGKVPEPQKASPWKDLGLEILPRPDRGANLYQVLYKGEPLANTKVIYETLEAEKLQDALSDKDGLVSFKFQKAGLYGLSARHAVSEKGEHNGKPFSYRRYISTLVIQVPEDPLPNRGPEP